MQTKFELYERVTPLANLGIWERNLLTGEIYWNSIIRSILEVDEHFSPELEETLQFYKDPELIRVLIEKAIISGIPELVKTEMTTAKGNSKWVQVRMQADCEQGKCTRIYGTLEDITENVSLQDLLEERERRFSMAFDHAPIGMALLSPAGDWIKVNLSLCKLLGYSPERFLQHTFQDFTHPDDLASDVDQMHQLLDGTIEAYSLEKRYFHADGHFIWALLNVSLVRDSFGAPLYFISQIKDISERKKSMEIISEQNRRLLNFAHIVSHNLRSHTGNIRMITDMIFNENDEAERNKLIKMLDVTSANLLETLDHLNEVVKVHDNGQADRIRLNLKHEIQRVLDILSGSIRMQAVQLEVDVDGEILVEFNPAYLESILINLIGNSIKYRHPDRFPLIKITAGRADRQIVLYVEDNGLGMDLELYGHKLFGMYKTFHRHPDARGMGLFLVKNQIEAMGATIEASSKPDVGTSFIVRFN
ncbi:MAG: PAS domain S-box protein [Bacteroidota bacterium]